MARHTEQQDYVIAELINQLAADVFDNTAAYSHLHYAVYEYLLEAGYTEHEIQLVWSGELQITSS